MLRTNPITTWVWLPVNRCHSKTIEVAAAVEGRWFGHERTVLWSYRQFWPSDSKLMGQLIGPLMVS